MPGQTKRSERRAGVTRSRLREDVLKLPRSFQRLTSSPFENTPPPKHKLLPDPASRKTIFSTLACKDAATSAAIFSGTACPSASPNA